MKNNDLPDVFLEKYHKAKQFFRIMKTAILLLFCSIQLVYAGNSFSQTARVSIQMKDVQLDKVLTEIEAQTDYLFIYNNKVNAKGKKLSVNAVNKPVNTLLSEILNNTDVSYSMEGNHIILSKKDVTIVQQSRAISGTIVDKAGEPLIGVSISIKGTTGGTLTDVDGKFTLNANEDNVIVVSYIGYKPQEIAVGNKTVFNIVLEESDITLDAVVVTALGIKRSEKALSYNVQQITNDDITSVKNANFMNSIAGKVAGVQINSSAAGPGSAVKVVMRGAKSISLTNNALYVIDGVPLNNYVGTGGGDGAMAIQPGTEGIADINPDDIESMSVLTGPSASALYGSEGANGVVLITTKKGKEGKTIITVSNSTSFSNPMKMPEFQNKYGNALSSNSGQSWGILTDKRFEPEKFFNTGTNIVNTVSLSTGTEKSQHYFSASANNANGILPNNGYDRYNFTYRGTAKFYNDKLTFNFGANYIIQEDKNMVSQGTYFNPLVSLYLFPRNEDFEEVGRYERYNAATQVMGQYWPFGQQGMDMQNPYWIMNKMNRENKRKRYMLSTSLQYDITKWLNVSGRVNVDNTNLTGDKKHYSGTLATFSGEKGRYALALRNDQQTYADVIANLNKTFEKFSLNINAGASIKDVKMDIHEVEGDLKKITNWFTTENTVNKANMGYFKINDDITERQTQSVFASAEIGYNHFLYLTLTGRNDWDSALNGSTEAQSFFYPSVGLSTLISEVVALPKWFTYLKAFGSFTSVGNSYSPYLTRNYIEYESSTGEYSMQKIRPNYDLKPEITNSWELGLNMKFLDNSLSLDATYYTSNTKNQTHILREGGDLYTHKTIQAGSVDNSGIELALGYQKKWGHFSWASNYTLTYNKNKIKKLVDPEDNGGMDYFIKSTLGSGGSPVTMLREGGSMGDIYATTDWKREYNGHIYLNPSTLLPEMVQYSDPKDYKKLGSLNPKYMMGWRNSFSYKGIRLNALISARFGGLVTSPTQAIMDRFGVSKASADMRDAGGNILVSNIAIPAQSWYNIIADGTGKGDYYVYKADNIRLQEVSLEYTLPKKWLNNIADVTLGLTGSNLFMIYCKAPFDPELSPNASSIYYSGVDYFMQPSLRNMGFSVKVQF